MPYENFKVEIKGLEEFKNAFNQKKINEQVALGIGAYTKKLHSKLRFAVTQMYDMGKNPKSLDTVLVGRTRDTADASKFSGNIIQGGLEYKHKPIPLAQFKFEWFWGNINKPPAKKKGRVHIVRVKRGRAGIVYGKEHRGGFVPIQGKKGSYKNVLSNGRVNFYERKGAANKPVRLLFGPSLAQMARKAWNSDQFPEVKQSLDNMESFIASQINL